MGTQIYRGAHPHRMHKDKRTQSNVKHTHTHTKTQTQTHSLLLKKNKKLLANVKKKKKDVDNEIKDVRRAVHCTPRCVRHGRDARRRHCTQKAFEVNICPEATNQRDQSACQ